MFGIPKPRVLAVNTARFFHRQGTLTELRIEPDMAKAMAGVEAIVLAVRHEPYLKLDPEAVVKAVGKPIMIATTMSPSIVRPSTGSLMTFSVRPL